MIRVKVLSVEQWVCRREIEIDEAELEEWRDGAAITTSLLREFLESERDDGDQPAWMQKPILGVPERDFEGVEIIEVQR